MKNSIYSIIIFLSFYFLPFTNVNAQNEARYLAGTVPEINGKVIFSDTLLLSGMNVEQIYELALMWAEANYNSTESRVAYINKEQAVISCKGKSELVFSSSALSLDRSFMNYQLNLFCLDNACRIEMKSISYEYNVSNKKEPEKYLAEKWITDKEAINGNKLYRMNGKFRMKTIDLFDDICNSLNINILTGEVDLYTDKDKSKLYDRKNPKEELRRAANQSINKQPQPSVDSPLETKETPIEIVKTQDTIVQPTTNVTPKTEEPLGFKKIDPEKIPGNIIKMLNNDWMLITVGNNVKSDMTTTSWGGLGVFNDKPVAYCFINPANSIYPLMENGVIYTLSFYTEAYRDALTYCKATSNKETDKVKGSGLSPITMPSGSQSFSEAWLIIECKKVTTLQMTEESTSNNKVYIGEIFNVWVK